jgi:hypothetical protein
MGSFEFGSGNQPSLKLWLTGAQCGKSGAKSETPNTVLTFNPKSEIENPKSTGPKP